MEVVASADGTPIACRRSGDGPPLVLVHGTAADHTRWAPVLPAFGEHFSVVPVDRRGRGESGDTDQWAIEREFEDVAAVVDWAGPDTVLLGHSFGAVCSLEAALLTDRIRRLVLYEPAYDPELAPVELVERLDALLAAGELLLQGEDTAGPFKKGTEAVRAALPDARVAVFVGQRHTAMNTATELFTSEVLGFAAPG